MAGDTPSGDSPIPEWRKDRTHNATTGLDDINTASHNDTPGTQTKVTVPESIGKMIADVTTDGAVTANVLPSGNVRVESGWAKMIADVELKPNVDPDPPHFRIGWVQTMLSSRRIGVYKTPKGDTISRVQASGKASDRRQYLPDDPTQPRQEVAAPWYDLPEELGTQHRKVHIHAFDKPGFPMAPTITENGPFMGAKLIAVQGSDSFLTSLKAGDAGDNTLKTWQWAVPWDVNVDGITSTRNGSNMTSGVSTEANPNQSGPTALAANHSDVLETYGTEDAAAQKLQFLGYAAFVAMLPRHKADAPASYWNMVGALWKSTAQIRVQVIRDKDALSEDVQVRFSADHDFGANRFGSSFTILAHMVLDPGVMTTPLAINVNGKVVMTVASPYHDNSAAAKITMPGAFFGTNENDVTVRFSIS